MKPIHLVLQPSRMLTVLLLSVSLAACLILLCMPVLSWLKALAILLISLATIWHVAKNALPLLSKSIIKLELTSEAEFFVTQRDGQKIKAEVLTTSFVAWYLVMLNLKLPSQQAGAACSAYAGYAEWRSFPTIARMATLGPSCFSAGRQLRLLPTLL